MASFLALQTPAAVTSLASSSCHPASKQRTLDSFSSVGTVAVARDGRAARSQCRENGGLTGTPARRLSASPLRAMKEPGSSADFEGDSLIASSGTEWEGEDESTSIAPLIWKSTAATSQLGIVLSTSTGAPLQSLTQDAAMGLVLREAVGTSWTTGSGLEGPTESVESESKTDLKFPDLSKSPRRRMRVAFTCNRCGERTVRAINPLAYTDGTVFVQCKGCDVFHKLIDNLNLFHEMKGKIYRGYDIPWYASEQPYNFVDDNYPML